MNELYEHLSLNPNPFETFSKEEGKTIYKLVINLLVHAINRNMCI